MVGGELGLGVVDEREWVRHYRRVVEEHVDYGLGGLEVLDGRADGVLIAQVEG